MSIQITKKDIEQALPANLKSSATQQLADHLNNLVQDPETGAYIRDHFISYAVVLAEGKWGIDAYMNAIQYATYKMMGYSNQDAYFRTFPQKQNDFIAKGTTAKDISSYVSMFHKGKLVSAILEKAMIPIHVLYQDVYHKAIQHQAHLMLNAQSEKVQTEAANSIMVHLGKPKDTAPTVAIQINNNAEMDAMKQMIADMAGMQAKLIESGVTAQDIAAQRLFPAPKLVEEGVFTNAD